MIFFEESFMLRALLAGCGLAIIAGPLGCFVTWRRMAYFGDALSHSALLGIALGLFMGMNLGGSVILVSMLFSMLIVFLQQQKIFATDTLLGILSHAALAFGVVIVSLLDGVRLDIFSYLFGDILSVNWHEVAWIYGGAAFCLASLFILWQKLLLLSIHQELAIASGVRTTLLQFTFMLLIAITIALAMRVVGVLLITSMLVIPAATARQVASSPSGMALQAAVFGMIAMLLGLSGSYTLDTPAGPSIAAAAALVFIAVAVLRGLKKLGGT